VASGQDVAMTRYAIDPSTTLRIIREGRAVSAEHQLVAPNALRSQVMSSLYRLTRSGEIDASEARALLDRLTELRIRLLGDRMSRGTAWRLATKLDWEDTAQAEYIAVAQLQADALITLDDDLARRAHGLVDLAAFEALRS
jgi:predicted nucleic acid-binding protein